MTIFTCALWTREVTGRQLAIVSNDLCHDKHSVLIYLEEIFSLIRSEYPHITSVRMFSDGCASQFKNKWIVSLVVRTSLSLTVTSWSFFATAHGKGLVDVIGGRAKSMIWMKVRSGKVIVKDANDFFNTARHYLPGITFLYIPESVIREDANIRRIKESWDDTLGIVGIRDAHHFERSDDNSISMSSTSLSDNHSIFVIRRSENLQEDHIKESPSTNPTKAIITQQDLRPGNWVAFMYDEEEYRGVIRNLSIPGRVTISSLEVTRLGTYKWPAKEDVLDYPIEDIIRLLDDPAPVGCGSRLQLRFEK